MLFLKQKHLSWLWKTKLAGYKQKLWISCHFSPLWVILWPTWVPSSTRLYECPDSGLQRFLNDPETLAELRKKMRYLRRIRSYSSTLSSFQIWFIDFPWPLMMHYIRSFRSRRFSVCYSFRYGLLIQFAFHFEFRFSIHSSVHSSIQFAFTFVFLSAAFF